ncbi:hypothetical protein QWZ13_01950 [Reinekea marina]|uniref:hypothetical protein n=1 Tax=Reinekea marina TaxID=1310421 RepID=UPI0025B35B47|nr:hypothetical protein [Reinekea marina]MDN3647669.1 hypothetical protein [Reinekea marina]
MYSKRQIKLCLFSFKLSDKGITQCSVRKPLPPSQHHLEEVVSVLSVFQVQKPPILHKPF